MIDPKLRTSLAYTDTMKDMLNMLKKPYAIVNAPKIHQLKTSTANYKQRGLGVVKFYSKINDLWVELENHSKIPYCTCEGCKCGVVNKIIQK